MTRRRLENLQNSEGRARDIGAQDCRIGDARRRMSRLEAATLRSVRLLDAVEERLRMIRWELSVHELDGCWASVVEGIGESAGDLESTVRSVAEMLREANA